jgi:adenosylcobinamide-GDP ribazoletransferase
MHDSRVGTGGLILGLLVILITLFCISEISRNLVVQSLVASEISAKLSMVILAFAGRSARKGLNTYFVDAMHGRHRIPRLIAAVAISLAIGLLLLNMKFVYIMLAAVIASLLMLAISNVQFKGVTGDVFGAVNEVSRMASLLTVLVMI